MTLFSTSRLTHPRLTSEYISLNVIHTLQWAFTGWFFFFTVLWFMKSSSSPSLQCEAVISGICKWGYVTLRHGHSFCHKIFSWKTWSNRLCGLLSMTCVVASDFHDHVSRSGSYGTQQGHRHMSWEVVEDPKKFEHAGFQSGWCKAALVFFHSCIYIFLI